MTARLYCSYFDHRYLAKGLAMIRSLRRHVPDAQVWVLCLSPQAEAILSAIEEPGVRIVTLAEVEEGDSGLEAARADGRSTIEYYFTLTPSLIRHVMNRTAAEIVTYLDGDLWFVADPEPIYREMGEASVVIIPHGFAPAMKHLEKFGIYNVGWVSFRSTPQGRACLEWWRARNNEWCFDRLDNGRFADQGYLDRFAELFTGVHVLRHRGANLAPWNVAALPVTGDANALHVGGDPLLFFHFHGLKALAGGETLTAHGFYKAPLTPLVRNALYVPYLREVDAITRALSVRFGDIVSGSVRHLHGAGDSWFLRLKSRLKLMLARRRGLIIPALKA